MKTHIKVPVWMGEIVKYHMERLRLLNLDGAPPGVAMGEVTRIWAETLVSGKADWHRELDAPRLHHAFLKLTRQADRWPAPRHLLDALPARPQPKALPLPEMSREQREANRARLRAMLKEALGNG